ncbi:DUF4230 domain-containing protein [uncultured Propionibacterium sp.]|uniref:DUF4230 domain-containing protein n=1 Tax=uncultured Propionibacterium sp. TaxID=218066 RepID=UPI0029314213|nr:DUF4230 domain-containing protein [uncultured Propionibacterium sp.]
MKKFKRVAIVLIAFVLVVVLSAIGLSIAGLLPGSAGKIDSTTITNSFEDIAELATEEYNFTNVGKYTKDQLKIGGVSIPFTDSSFLITYSGTVKAGIADISQVSASINDATKTVTVKAPAVRALDSSIDPASIKTYDQSFDIVNRIKVDDVASFLASEESNAEQIAEDQGLLDKARTQAETLLKTHVKTVTDGTRDESYSVNVSWDD